MSVKEPNTWKVYIAIAIDSSASLSFESNLPDSPNSLNSRIVRERS